MEPLILYTLGEKLFLAEYTRKKDKRCAKVNCYPWQQFNFVLSTTVLSALMVDSN